MGTTLLSCLGEGSEQLLISYSSMEDLFERLSEATKKHDQIVYNLRVADEIGAMRLSEERRHMTEECKPGIDYNF